MPKLLCKKRSAATKQPCPRTCSQVIPVNLCLAGLTDMARDYGKTIFQSIGGIKPAFSNAAQASAGTSESKSAIFASSSLGLREPVRTVVTAG